MQKKINNNKQSATGLKLDYGSVFNLKAEKQVNGMEIAKLAMMN